MKMTDHQKRLWQEMVDEIQGYIDEPSNNFYSLVGRLESALDASDITDKRLIELWYNF